MMTSLLLVYFIKVLVINFVKILRRVLSDLVVRVL